MPRVTLTMDEQLLAELKHMAAARRETLSSLVDDLLRQELKRARDTSGKEKRVLLPSFPMGRPRINIAELDQLND